MKKNKSVANRNENGVELINKEGRSYLIPANNKDAPVINSFRRWEQAFRVYAGIFPRQILTGGTSFSSILIIFMKPLRLLFGRMSMTMT